MKLQFRYNNKHKRSGLKKILSRNLKKSTDLLPKKSLLGIMASAILFLAIYPAFIGGSVSASRVDGDWAGGQNTQSSENVDVSNPGHITLDGAGISDWCNTAKCDTTFTKRQRINIVSDQARTDYQVLLDVPYDSDMNNDYSDLRFTTLDGTTDINYFNRPQEDSSSRKIFVKIPNLSIGVNSIYLYYGNSGASSLSSASSTLLFEDNFDTAVVDGATNTSNFYFNDTQGFSVSSGKLQQDGTSPGGNGFGPNAPQLTRADRTATEFRLKIINNNCTDDYSCGVIQPNLAAGNYPNPWNLYGFDISPNYNDYSGSAQPSTYSASIVNDINPSGTSNYKSKEIPEVQTQAVNGTPVTYRISVGQTQASYATSQDSGGTFVSASPPTNIIGVQDNFGLNFYMNQASIFEVDNIYQYKVGASIANSFSTEEDVNGQSGILTSPILDMGAGAYYGDLSFEYTGGGTAKVRIRNSNDSNMTGSPAIESCGDLSSGDAISSSNCFVTGGRYFQYQIFLTDANPGDIDFTEVTIEFVNDLTEPDNPSGFTLKRSSTGQVLSSGDWVNQGGYLSWDVASDNVGGSGIGGYCVYLGVSSVGVPTSSAGIISPSSSPLGSGTCPYATLETDIDLADLTLVSPLTDNNTYYLRVLSYDLAGNIASSSPGNISFKYDETEPYMNTVFSGPSNVVNTLKYPINWLIDSGAFANDDTSGFAGIKYCVTNINIGISGCDRTDNNWYGASHTSGQLSDTSDVIPFSDGTFSLTDADAARQMMNGPNFVIYAGVDNAGNAAVIPQPGIVTITSDQSATPPQNLSVSTPPPNTNSYSFTWSQPATFIGPASAIDYCWSVNEIIASDASNCSWTGVGITQLAAGPYALQQGANTMYIISKDQTGNFNASNFASVEFNATTVAPGVPRNLEVTDVSTKATSTWKLALSWSAPTSGSITSYKVMRSLDGSAYSEVGSTSNSNLSFIDTGLSQVPYYYKVKACDNAGSCGVAVTPSTGRTPDQFPMTPTGRFTTPANLATGSGQPKVSGLGTRKATINWVTDRSSDSRIAFGTNSGQYSPSEISNSSQTANHEVALSNLIPNTTYYYIARWSDTDGNIGHSAERTFRTLPAPSVSEVTPTNLTVSSADIDFQSKDSTQIKIYYGKSEGFGGLQAINTSTVQSRYTIRLDSLDDGTKYFFRMNGVDNDGNEYDGDIYSFTTPARPRISNLKFQPVENATSNTQQVSWSTNVPTTTRLRYGPQEGKTIETIDSKLVLEHKVTIKDLIDDTDYQLTAISSDEKNNVATSGPHQFRTALDTRPPEISNVNVETSIVGTGSEAKGQLIISWKTDEKATSQVAYGPGQEGSFSSRTGEDARLTTDHVVVISDLQTSSIFHLQAISGDKADNRSNSETQTVIISRGSENVFSIILNSLQKIFGLGE